MKLGRKLGGKLSILKMSRIDRMDQKTLHILPELTSEGKLFVQSTEKSLTSL